MGGSCSFYELPLSDAKALWEAFVTLEQTAIVVKKAATFLKGLGWTNEQWAMQVLHSLAEVDFREVPPYWATEISDFVNSIFGSYIIEEMNNKARTRAMTHKNKSLEPKSLWHCCALGSSTLADFDRPALRITPSARLASDGKVDASLFEYTDKDCSIDEHAFKSLTARNPAYPTQATMTEAISPIATSLMVKCAGDWAQISLGFYSALAQPGALLRNATDKKPRLVTYSCEFGSAAVTPRIQKLHGNILAVTIVDEAALVEFHHLTSPDGWKCVGTIMRVPCEKKSKDVMAESSYFLHASTASTSLLEWSADIGFKGLTLDMFRRLFDNQKVPWPKGARPTTTTGYVSALYKFIKKEKATEEGLEFSLVERDVKNDLEFLEKQTPLGKLEFQGVVDDGDGIDDDNCDVQAEVEKIRLLQIADAIKRRVLAREAAREMMGVEPAVPKPAAKPDRKFCPKKETGYKKEEALALVPPGGSLHKDFKENRWRGKYEHKQANKSYGAGTGLSDYQAMATVLVLLWKMHTEKTGHQCPWEFDDVPCLGGG